MVIIVGLVVLIAVAVIGAGLRRSRREAAAVSRDRDDLADQRETARAGNGRPGSQTSDLVQLAVMKERAAFAKDLHDLLGYGLSAIILKAEFSKCLVVGDPDRACTELAEVIEIARQALTDVRKAASNYRSMSMAKEASPVASLLGAAGISAKVEINCEGLDEEIDTVLAIVLREAVTNVLWRSSARNCTIEGQIDDCTVRLRVANDGLLSPVPPGRASGTGLQNLSARLAAIGGELTVEIRDNWFVLEAQAPITRGA